MYPLIPFSDVEKTTSAMRSRATIFNPRQKYCVGETFTVQVEMFDYVGNRKTYGGDFMKARIFSEDHKSAASGRIEDLHNGIYHVYFTLFWEGKAYVSLVLHHPSEAVSALWRARNQDYRLIYFLGTFSNGTHPVKSKCGFHLNTHKEICYYSNGDKESFSCYKPEAIHCKSLIFLQSFNENLSFLSTQEKNLFKRENIAVEIPKNFQYIDVNTCAVSFSLSLQPCKIGMKPPFPSGFVFQGKWRPIFCNVANFTILEMYKCLDDKMIYLLGDSTLRQWFLYLRNIFPDLKPFNLHRQGMESVLLSLDLKKNLQLLWKKHSHPIVTNEIYSIKDDQYINELIDNLAGGPNYVIVISLGQHFRPFPLHLFIKRVINIHKALQRLFLRSPDTKIIIKSENTRERNVDAERFSDFHGYIQYLIVKDLFSDLPVAVIDAWDMTIAYNTDDIHPPVMVVQEQIYMFFTYLCSS
ncbi:NXPE family member 1-like [Hyperolius riggenbachi]|uniref:NXPE family member 1-like n=1 Tax=Hyperolius riggenbachi TaxID=752182 RepID=UPI0035A38FDA